MSTLEQYVTASLIFLYHHLYWGYVHIHPVEVSAVVLQILDFCIHKGGNLIQTSVRLPLLIHATQINFPFFFFFPRITFHYFSQ